MTATLSTPWGRLPLETPPPHGDMVSIRLSAETMSILYLAAAHDGVSPGALISRLVCQHAETIGLAALADEHERRRAACHGNSAGKSGHG